MNRPRSKWTRFWPLLALGCFALLATAGEGALKRVSFEELTHTANRIVHGKVVGMNSFYGVWSDAGDNLIVTEVTVQPLTALKGDPREPVVFRIAGGKVGEQEMVASESPVVEMGSEVVVFVARHALGFDYLYAHWHGKYDVLTGAGRGKRVRGIPGAPIRRTMALKDLVVQVAAVEKKRIRSLDQDEPRKEEGR